VEWQQAVATWACFFLFGQFGLEFYFGVGDFGAGVVDLIFDF
jgi:hypothetical protein